MSDPPYPQDGTPITVEFFGPPAAGKSTLARAVATQLQARNIAVRQPTAAIAHGPGRGPRTLRKTARKIRLAAGELLARPGASLRALRELLATRQRNTVLLLRMAFHWLLVTALLRRPTPAVRVRLFDQGVFQALWSIALEARREDLDRRLPRLLDREVPLPDVLVVLDVSPETVQRRLEARQGHESRLDLWSRRDPGLLPRGQTLIPRLTRLIEALPFDWRRPLVLRLPADSDRTLTSNARAVTAEIETLLFPPGADPGAASGLPPRVRPATPGSPPSPRGAAPRD